MVYAIKMKNQKKQDLGIVVNVIYGGVVSCNIWLRTTKIFDKTKNRIIGQQSFKHFILGEKCNRKIHNIPYKPLSERMLEEPFWLGLIAVTVVMSIIGICYLFKKHLPDKFDKILNTGTDLTKNANADGQIGNLDAMIFI